MPENVILLMWTVSKIMCKCFKSLTYRLFIVTRHFYLKSGRVFSRNPMTFFYAIHKVLIKLRIYN